MTRQGERDPKARRSRSAHAALAASVLLLACVAGARTCRAEATRDLSAATPGEAGLDPRRLDAAVVRLGEMSGVRVVLVARGGRTVAERAFRGASLTAPHDVKSASKSLLGSLTGMAIERGLLAGTEQPLREALPAHASRLQGPKAAITVGHLLEMSTGLQSTSGAAYGRWVSGKDWVAGALDRPLVARPGASFMYSTGNTHVLSAVIAQVSGSSPRAAMQEWLLDPLGIRLVSWATDPQGLPFGGNSLSLRPRDLLKLGQLHLDGGTWLGRRVVPETWIRESTTRRQDGWPDRYGAYGRLWWLPPQDPGAFMAVGYGGQFVHVSVPRDMVVVVLSDHAGKGAAWDREALRILRDEIGGAIVR